MARVPSPQRASAASSPNKSSMRAAVSDAGGARDADDETLRPPHGKSISVMQRCVLEFTVCLFDSGEVMGCFPVAQYEGVIDVDLTHRRPDGRFEEDRVFGLDKLIKR